MFSRRGVGRGEASFRRSSRRPFVGVRMCGQARTCSLEAQSLLTCILSHLHEGTIESASEGGELPFSGSVPCADD